jgi:putative holliday junction resolvase
MSINQYHSRWIALDVGTRRIGVAVSDPLRVTARPLKTLVRTPDGAEFRELVRLVDEYEVSRIIVGRPVRLSGEESEGTRQVEAFITELSAVCPVRIVRAEERLSSKEAERMMAEVGIAPADRRRRRDEFAAALILQWYLEERGDRD